MMTHPYHTSWGAARNTQPPAELLRWRDHTSQLNNLMGIHAQHGGKEKVGA
jgi:hypothetical protein